MWKQLFTTFFVLLLLAPHAELEAKGRHQSRHGNDHKFTGFPHSTRAELNSLNLAISDINARIDILENQFGGIPEDLATTLEGLRLVIEANSSDLSLALEDITGILIDLQAIFNRLDDNGGRIDDLELMVVDLGMNLADLESRVGGLELRILALEQSGPPLEPGATFSGDFTQGQASNITIRQAWSVFKSNVTGSFASIQIRNSQGGSAICDDPVATTQIAAELNAHVPTNGSLTSFSCQGLVWNVGSCAGGVELNAGLNAEVCACNQNAVVRPEINNDNWGGVGTDFGGVGGTCGAPSQGLEVILTR